MNFWRPDGLPRRNHDGGRQLAAPRRRTLEVRRYPRSSRTGSVTGGGYDPDGEVGQPAPRPGVEQAPVARRARRADPATHREEATRAGRSPVRYRLARGGPRSGTRFRQHRDLRLVDGSRPRRGGSGALYIDLRRPVPQRQPGRTVARTRCRAMDGHPQAAASRGQEGYGVQDSWSKKQAAFGLDSSPDCPSSRATNCRH